MAMFCKIIYATTFVFPAEYHIYAVTCVYIILLPISIILAETDYKWHSSTPPWGANRFRVPNSET